MTRELLSKLFCVYGLCANRFSQGLAWLEVRNAPFRDLHTFAGTRVASHARRTAIDRKAAKAPDLDPVAACQGVTHGVENSLDSCFCVAVRELTKSLGQQFNKI